MRHAHPEEARAERRAVHRQLAIGPTVRKAVFSQVDLDETAFDRRTHRSRQRLERHFCRSDAALVGKAGYAACAVAAHLALRAVGVEQPHFKVRACRGLYDQQPVGADRSAAAAEPARQRAQFLRLHRAGQRLDRDEVVAVAVDLPEFHERFLHKSFKSVHHDCTARTRLCPKRAFNKRLFSAFPLDKENRGGYNMVSFG